MSAQLTKICKLCKEDKSLSEYYIAKNKPMLRCKCCVNKNNNERNRKNYIKRTRAPYKKPTQNRTEKKCYDCNIIKPLFEFNKNKSISDGHATECKICKKKRDQEYRELNKEQLLLKLKEYKKQFRKENPEKARAIGKKYANDRRVCKIQGSLDTTKYKKEIIEIYSNCPNGYEVDHIIPLKGKQVCGLHVPWNLQYLTKDENRSKGNKVVEYVS